MLRVNLEFSFKCIAYSSASFVGLLSTLAATSKSQSTRLENCSSLLFFLLHCFLSCSAFNLIWTPAALTPFSFTDHRSPPYQGVLASSTNHILPRYSNGLLPRLQILSSHGSLPWTNYLILKLSGGIPHPPLLLSFSPDHIIPHYTQFCFLSHPISQYIWNISSL